MGTKDIKRKRQEGFTIIEVMIVLVIAAVIMLMVFLAVPALQRSSRNTQRKNDVAGLLAAVNEYTSNHNGQLPTAKSDFIGNVKLGFYDPTTEVIYIQTGNSGSVPVNDTRIYIAGKVKCSGTAASTTGATTRQFVAGYNVETGSGLNQAQCQEG